MRTTLSSLILALLVTGQYSAEARTVRNESVQALAPPHGVTDNATLAARRAAGLFAAAAANTVWLHSADFDNGSACSPQGWTSVDHTAQIDAYWHVDDYAGLPSPYGPLEGTRSLWCGVRPGGGPIYCTYQTLPGYGNNWRQQFCTKTCVTVAGGPTTGLDVAFAMRFDTEPGYDWTTLEYTADCSGDGGWGVLDGGTGVWDGSGQVTVDNSYPLSGNPAQVKVRLRFISDGAYSDQDGIFPTNGAVSIDSLKVEGLALETFEDEALGATSSNDWEVCNDAFGDYAGLFKGSELLQEDPCVANISCIWAFIQGSTATYACGGHPEQTAVPYEGPTYAIENDIWSPYIEITGSGSDFKLAFDVYRDLPTAAPLAILVYTWKVRTIVNGCPTAWKSDNFLYTGDQKDWYRHVADIGSRVDVTNATHLQVAIGVWDLCPSRCWGPPPCHSHSPLIDNVKVFRVDVPGPRWAVRDIDLFQDTFSADGTTTGTATVDAALDVKLSSSPSVTPGDSIVVQYIVDPTFTSGSLTGASGLLDDPNVSTYPLGRATHATKRQAYLWVQAWPYDGVDDPGDRVGEDLAATWIDGGVDLAPGGQANRWPFAGTETINGTLWTKIRMDYVYTGTPTNPGTGINDPIVARRFCVDLNDDVFVPGDTILYFFSASSAGGTTYYSDQWVPTTSIAEVAANPMEVTILPAGGFNRGGDILYVDGADGLGNQTYFEGAFMVLALGIGDLVDRYDVRGPSSAVDNRLASRVVNVQNQLNNCYGVILWDTGSLPVTLADGSGNPEKRDDYGLLNTFLANLTNPGGVYLSGDDLAQNLAASTSSSAATFKSTYLPFTLSNSNHGDAGFGVSPTIYFWPGRHFNDNFIAYGGCPQLDDFDVLGASGTSLVEMSYGAASSPAGGVLSNVNGNARVLLSGFSFAAIRDDETNGFSDRGVHLSRILSFLSHGVGPATGADGPMHSDALAQNYPNPFNPTTTIAFSLKTRARVTLNVYDVGGRLVRTLANEVRAAGPHAVTWDGQDGNGDPVASGVYFYRLNAGAFSQTRKMVLLK